MSKRPTWDDIWMSMAEELGARSRCSRGSIGCVIVSTDNRIAAASYVGPAPRFAPANEDPTTDCRSWCKRSQPGHKPEPGYVDCVSSHAEMNAIARADYSLIQGGTVYVNGTVCFSCAKLLAASGVKRVVMRVLSTDLHRNPAGTVKYLTVNNIDVTVRLPETETEEIKID